MKLKIDFSFGIEYRGDGSAILGHEQVEGMEKICYRAIDLFDGYTRYDTFGAWRDPDTKITVTEAGCMISVLSDGIWGPNHCCLIDPMVRCIKDNLQQKAVAVTRTEVQFDIL